MEISTSIALGSLIVSIFTILWTGKQQRQINKFLIKEFKQKESVQKQALIKSEYHNSTKTGVIIRIYNRGYTPARNIRMESKDINDDPNIELSLKEQLPYTFLNVDDYFEMRLKLSIGRKPSPKITYIWDDDFAKDNRREQILIS